MHALVEAADVPGPYVLVGHSLGGIFVRQYAGAYPDEVAGLVLVDPSHEDQEVVLEELVGPELWAQYERTEAGFVDVEGLDVDATFDETRHACAAAPLPEVPLVVLTHGVPLDASQLPTGWPIQADERQWRELHADLAGLVPGGHQIIAERSGHYIQIDQPELVVAAIREVGAEMSEAGKAESPPVGGNGGSTEIERSAGTEATASGAIQPEKADRC